jgi:hypothetical protein
MESMDTPRRNVDIAIKAVDPEAGKAIVDLCFFGARSMSSSRRYF